MGEALMFRHLDGSSGGGFTNRMITEIFDKNDVFIVPEGAKNNEFSVICVGGGGGSCASFVNVANFWAANSNKIGAGGGGGWVNKNTFTLKPGESIPITIGSGGNGVEMGTSVNIYGGNGGTTSFGTYLSAAGGEGGSFRYINSWYNGFYGGNGGSGGGAHSAGNNYAYGGQGYQFGGGGGDGAGGNGGTYGGGGAGENNSRGKGGTYGGNGWTPSRNSTAGTNTMSNSSIDISLRGNGNAGYRFSSPNQQFVQYYGGGGGGYGGDGGIYYGASVYCSGGGGYGANGGSVQWYGSGGGGGYGKAGYGGNSSNICAAGGGGSYGHGASSAESATYGGGGAAYIRMISGGGIGLIAGDMVYDYSSANGANGLIIIQYQV